jgi:hypothetical protein
MKLYKIALKNNMLIHAPNYQNDDFTLCAIAISDENNESIEEIKKGNYKQLTCPQCLMVIRNILKDIFGDI